MQRAQTDQGAQKRESTGASEEDWIDARIESVVGVKEPQRNRSTATVTTNIQKSPLDKQFFMKKIKMSKRINQQRPPDLSLTVGQSCLSQEHNSPAKLQCAAPIDCGSREQVSSHFHRFQKHHQEAG